MAIELLLDDSPHLVARILRYYWYRQADVAAPLAVSVAATLLVMRGLASSTTWQTLTAMGPLAAGGAWLLTIAVSRSQDATPPAVARMAAPADWIAACLWIREQTPLDAVFLVPRHAQSFKWYAQRADAGNWKDVPQDAMGLLQWRRRMTELYTAKSNSGAAVVISEPAKLGARRVRSIAEKFGVDYVITLADPPLALRQVFPAEADAPNAYRVYAIGDSIDRRNPRKSSP